MDSWWPVTLVTIHTYNNNVPQFKFCHRHYYVLLTPITYLGHGLLEWPGILQILQFFALLTRELAYLLCYAVAPQSCYPDKHVRCGWNETRMYQPAHASKHPQLLDDVIPRVTRVARYTGRDRTVRRVVHTRGVLEAVERRLGWYREEVVQSRIEVMQDRALQSVDEDKPWCFLGAASTSTGEMRWKRIRTHHPPLPYASPSAAADSHDQLSKVTEPQPAEPVPEPSSIQQAHVQFTRQQR